jgi:TRAP-type C4-dicarboxylate transport system substrate-binding protein
MNSLSIGIHLLLAAATARGALAATSAATHETLTASPIAKHGAPAGETAASTEFSLSGERKPVRLATLAPKGSSMYKSLEALRERWTKAPDGGVKLVIYPDGVMGSEADIVRKMRAEQIQAGVLTVAGLQEIDKSVTALQNLPLLFRSLDEAAYVREKLRPVLERRFEEKGFVMIFLGDVGWVHFFSKEPVIHPDDLKKVKLFSWTGDNQTIDLMKSLGLHPVPLEPTDILTGLQTGLIDAVAMVPFFALAAQIYSPTPHMLDLNWAPLVGAGVVLKKTWDGFPDALRDDLRSSARAIGVEIIDRQRVENDESIQAMQKRGLVVHHTTPAIEAEWRAFVEPVYPKLRGVTVPADLYDEAVSSLSEFRAKASSSK